MKQVSISAKARGFSVSFVDTGEAPSQLSAYPGINPPPYSAPCAEEAAFSTLGEALDYVREIMGEGPVNQASDCVGASVGAGAPDVGVDWESRDRRMSALNHAAALAYKEGGSPDDVLAAARRYDNYLRGEGETTTDKPSPEA